MPQQVQQTQRYSKQPTRSVRYAELGKKNRNITESLNHKLNQKKKILTLKTDVQKKARQKKCFDITVYS